ncbi:unnamed protein product [Echinostoma caproni]|uniref:Retrotrans_gag domain-containing protein n=1 Tax=Echinostoma caproni TaxID=27848 RepID=A0A183BF07_9TREM|nr:unnamed protein product [Echinostoma caproni]
MDTCNLEILDIHSNSRYAEDYLERFEIFCLTRKSVNGEKEIAHFLSAVGKEAYALIKTLTFPESPIQLKYKELKDLLLKHFHPVNFEAAERVKFHCLARNPNQSVRDFILQLQTQAARCNFKDQLQNLLRDGLIAGINCSELQQQLLLIPNCTFQTEKVVCEQYQDVRAALREEPKVLSSHNRSSALEAQQTRQFKSVNGAVNHNLRSAQPTNNNVCHWNSCKSCDTGSVNSFISKTVPQRLEPRVYLNTTDILVKGITGHNLPVLGLCELLLPDDKQHTFNCFFLFIDSDISIIGLDSMKRMEISLSFSNDDQQSRLHQLVLKCSKNKGGIKMAPIHLEFVSSPIFLKRPIIPLGLPEPVKKVLDDLVEKGVLTPVDSSVWATPIVVSLKRDGKTQNL